VDADGKVLGTVKDGQVIDAGGKVLGTTEQAVLGRDGTPLTDAVLVVRDANGNILGTVVGNDVIDAEGRKIGYVRDGKVYDLDGNLIPGATIGLRQDAQQVVRDAQGNLLGSVRGGAVYGADGKVIGKVIDGKVVDANGNVVARGISLGVETPRETATGPRRREAVRMIQFIPGGTGKQGVIPVQTLRLE